MINFSKAIGANTDLLTAQAFTFFKQDQKTNQKIFLGAVISASGDDVFTKVRVAGSKLQEKFQELDQDINQILPILREFLISELSDVDELKLQLILWQDQTVLLDPKGDHLIHLFEKNQISNLTKSSPQDQQPANEEIVLSGILNHGDKLLILTTDFEDQFSPISDNKEKKQSIVDSLKKPQPNLEEEFDNYFQSNPSSDPLAAILLTYHQQGFKHNLSQAQKSLPKVKLPSNLSIRSIPKNKKTLIYLASIALFFVLAFSTFKFFFPPTKSQNSQVNFYLQKAEEKYNSAKSLKSQNPDQATADINDSLKLLDQALALDSKNGQVLGLKTEIENSASEIAKIYQISDWPVFLSLDLLKSGFTSSKMAYSLGQIVLLSESTKTLVSLDLTSKNNQILAGENVIGAAEFAGINGNIAYTYSYDRGITRIDMQKRQDNQIVKPDPEWGRVSDIFAFGGNIYLLDEFKNQIWKYSPIESGYSNKFPYLQDGTTLTNGRRLRIDYSVWVLANDADIYKYTAGAEDYFSFSGLDKPVSKITSFFIGEDPNDPFSENSYAYFLDPENSRLLVTSKQGKYHSQYIGEKFATATDLVVDEENKKLYLLEGNKIYQLDLK